MAQTVVDKVYTINEKMDDGSIVSGKYTIEYTYASTSGAGSVTPTATLKSADFTSVDPVNPSLSQHFVLGAPTGNTITGGALSGTSFSSAIPVTVSPANSGGNATIGFTVSTGTGNNLHDAFSISFTDTSVDGTVSGIIRPTYTSAELDSHSTAPASYSIVSSSLTSYTNSGSSGWNSYRGDHDESTWTVKASTSNNKIDSNDHLVCYAKGTLIATATGEVAIEKLREGDLVLTVTGE
jgi:Hint domain